MRYSFEFKKRCVELYREGKWPETPVGTNKENIQRMVRRWVRVYHLSWTIIVCLIYIISLILLTITFS